MWKGSVCGYDEFLGLGHMSQNGTDLYFLQIVNSMPQIAAEQPCFDADHFGIHVTWHTISISRQIDHGQYCGIII